MNPAIWQGRETRSPIVSAGNGMYGFREKVSASVQKKNISRQSKRPLVPFYTHEHRQGENYLCSGR